MHNPTTTVYPTGVPGGGDKPPANAVTFKVYQDEMMPWATGTFVNPPGMTLYGWNIPLSWSTKSRNSVAIAKAQTANHPDIVRSVTVQ